MCSSSNFTSCFNEKTDSDSHSSGWKSLHGFMVPSSRLSPPAYIQVSNSKANECDAVQSIRSGFFPFGEVSNKKAPAPAGSIHRRKSFLKAIIGSFSNVFNRATSASYFWACIQGAIRSDPVEIALEVFPEPTER